MKVGLYAIRGSLRWALRITLDMYTDLYWWSNGMETKEEDGHRPDQGKGEFSEAGQAEGLLQLSSGMPLGWAVTLRDEFGLRPVETLDGWTARDWMRYMEEALAAELEEERKGIVKDGGRGEPVGIRSLNEVANPQWLWTRGRGLTTSGAALLRGRGHPEAGPREAARVADALAGRSLLEAELQQLLAERLPELGPAWRSALQLAHLQGRVQLTSGVARADARGGAARPLARRAPELRCRRCGSGVHRRTPCGSCGCGGCAYCEACLALGRSRSCALLLRGSSADVPPAAGGGTGSPTGSLLDRWGLSPAQREAAGAALRFLAQPGPVAAPTPRAASPEAGGPLRLLPARLRPRRAAPPGPAPGPPRFLLWAVTGAGKTEMIFPLLRYSLDRGGKVLVATPRRDVVLELGPRIAQAFPEVPTAVLYGGSPQRWEEARLFLSTTHQLMRFYQAFDLVIIDEIDAFPYHNDPMLEYAAEQSCKPSGRYVFLSATPPAPLQREVRSGRLPHAKVPARFHGHPLPLPRRIVIKPVDVCLRRGELPKALLSALETSMKRGAQIFIFVALIRHIEPVVALLRRHFSAEAVEGTSSQDKQRGDHVLEFRTAQTRILVTTTILERGVTVPKSDVYILDADSELFDEASLVQMAGRAGRSKDDPKGRVVFASPEWTRSQKGAVRQIREMNEMARKQGFLKEDEEVVKK
ncbi:DEAD/DEAH box helicase [Paenibacillus sp. A14]|uniref:DEAD/DEAH box helicase n=1 Tax=Paenibacillus sp. A14 TaxID=3119820 RepID=UPI002FDFF59A